MAYFYPLDGIHEWKNAVYNTRLSVQGNVGKIRTGIDGHEWPEREKAKIAGHCFSSRDFLFRVDFLRSPDFYFFSFSFEFYSYRVAADITSASFWF